MSKIDSLKQQYPELNVSVIDVLARLDSSKTYKYLPMFCKMICDYRDNQKWNEIEKEDVKYNLTRKNIKFTKEEELNFKYILALNYVSDAIPRDLFDGSKEFMEYMERGLIENKDVLTYTSLEDMRGAVAVASLKAQSKELEKQVVKVHEDDEWLVVRPLTFEASAKYGAGTKWCTTYQTEKNYFSRYWRRGILAYFINKVNGSKWGMFKNLDLNHEDELSWWNVVDKRVDFLEINFNETMYGVVKTLLQHKQSNKELCDDELQVRVMIECDPSSVKITESPYLNLNEAQLTTAIVPPYPEPVGDNIFERMDNQLQQQLNHELVERLLREYGTRIAEGAQIPSMGALDSISNEIQQYQDQEPQNGG